MNLALPVASPTKITPQAGDDYATIRAGDLGRLEPSDARLNTWILAWVQRSLLHDPASLYDGNIFHPARRVITQARPLLKPGAPLLMEFGAGQGEAMIALAAQAGFSGIKAEPDLSGLPRVLAARA